VTRQQRGFQAIGDLTRADPRTLAKALGSSGRRLLDLARGRDNRLVDPAQARKSLSAETTFDQDLNDLKKLESRPWPLCARVARRARLEGFVGRAIVLTLRTQDFRILTRRQAAPTATQTAKTPFAVSRALPRGKIRGESYRLIGVEPCDLSAEAAETDMFAVPETRTLREETTVDEPRRRYGDQILVNGRTLIA
jgi:DNA polymerase-4